MLFVRAKKGLRRKISMLTLDIVYLFLYTCLVCVTVWAVFFAVIVLAACVVSEIRAGGWRCDKK